MRFTILLLSVLLASCGAYTTDDSMLHTNWPDRSTLFSHFRTADTAFIIYGKEEPDLGAALNDVITAMDMPDDRFKIILQRDDKLTETQATRFPLYVIGTAKNLLIHRLDENIPVNFIDNGFEFDGIKYMDRSDILKISFFPNVFNPQLPISVVTGNNEQELIAFIQNGFASAHAYFLWDTWGYQVYHHGERVVLGNFSEDTATRWSIDKKIHWDFNYTGEKIASSAHINIISHNTEISKTGIAGVTDPAELNIDAIEKFTGKQLTQPINYHIYPSAEIKSLMLDNADQSAIDFDKKEIHTVITDEYRQRPDEAVSIITVRNLLGITTLPVLEAGLAIRFTQGWEKLFYPYEGQRLAMAGLLPEIETLLDYVPFQNGTDFRMRISAVLFTEFLVLKFGQDQFLAQYNNWNKNELIALEQEWEKYALTEANSAEAVKSPIRTDTAFLKGFNFAHEGYQIFNGYMGTEAEASLKHLKGIGVNSVTLIPYSGYKSMTKPFPFEVMTAAGAENDASIIRAAWVAHKNGMSVMLKPQLWSWLGWTGDIKMENDADWDLFFSYYEDWIVHYALLAEAYDIEMFCIGVEFENASVYAHDKWDTLFDKIRKIYSGKITYAANWGTEFETVSFWDKLDFISVNCYYPLSDKKDATDEELLAGFEKNLDLIEKAHIQYKKPVVFTEIGFKSITAPWINPHMDDDTNDYSGYAQQRCYSVMQKALEDEPWVRGVYIWKWPSYMEFAMENNKDFTPCGKPAEQTIKNWFSEN